MAEVLSSLPAFSEPLFFGCLGAVSTLVGSVLRSGLNATPRKVGNCFCVFGLALMTIGFLCVTSDMSLIAYAQRG
ncbi:MAG: hypothetical protein DELT_01423 [Desulfovibrio sp.]